MKNENADSLFQKKENYIYFLQDFFLYMSYLLYLLFSSLLLWQRITCRESADPHRSPWPCPLTWQAGHLHLTPNHAQAPMEGLGGGKQQWLLVGEESILENPPWGCG